MLLKTPYFFCAKCLYYLCHLQVFDCQYEGCALCSNSVTLHVPVVAWAGLCLVVIQQNYVLCKLGFLCKVFRRKWNCVQCQRKAFSVKPFPVLTLYFCKDGWFFLWIPLVYHISLIIFSALSHADLQLKFPLGIFSEYVGDLTFVVLWILYCVYCEWNSFGRISF